MLKKEGREIEFWELYGNKKELQGVTLVERKQIAKGRLSYIESLWGPVWLPSLSVFEINNILKDSTLLCCAKHIFKGGREWESVLIQSL